MSVPFPPFKPDATGRVFEKILWLAKREIDTRGLESMDTDESAERSSRKAAKLLEKKLSKSMQSSIFQFNYGYLSLYESISEETESIPGHWQ